MPWLKHASALVPMWLSHEDGRPFAGDPRHAGSPGCSSAAAARGWTVQAATEMEFYLVDDAGPRWRRR
ncbi:MAG: hypothetical protein R3D85_12570 [Paracoccaceae bacterium]